jgi:5-methylcytosine-specific restriction endonuclease McrA
VGRYINLVGQRFGKLLVVERVINPKSYKAYFRCLCDCGRTKTIGSYYLQKKMGNEASCGCERKIVCRTLSDPKDASYNNVITGYRLGAKKRNKQWLLTREEAIALMHLDCHYCGVPPSQNRNAYDWKRIVEKTIAKSAKQWKANAAIIINGIDRVDNSGDYTKDNCVSCCKTCNAAKSDMTLEEFTQWLLRIAKHYGTKTDNIL